MTAATFITGASRGIGRAIALALAGEGHSLFLLARDEQALKSCVSATRDLGAQVDFLAGDLKDRTYADLAIARAKDRFGEINVLINNAGKATHQPVQALDMAVWQDTVEVNLDAAVYLCSRIVPQMIDRRAGAIINISSISARITSAGSAIYCASKHALNGFTGCLYEDVREYGIKVSAIMPGFVNTALTAGAGLDVSKMIQPEDVADAVRYVLSSSAACCPTEIVLRPQSSPLRDLNSDE
ncbi:MAG: SDR family oxidoreductase [Pseudomonadota bacterium]